MTARLILTACQLRMARACLRWSVDQLAREAAVSTSTIRRLEGHDSTITSTTIEVMGRIQSAFERHGVTFLSDDDPTGAGIRYHPINQD